MSDETGTQQNATPVKDEDIWDDDLLGREADANFLIEFLKNRIEERRAVGLSKSYVLNIDAAWGQGKTFFLQRLRQQLEANQFLVAYVNAWEDDHADDPLVAVIASLDSVIEANFARDSPLVSAWTAVRKYGLEIAVTGAKGALVTLAKRAFGEGFDEIKEILDQPDNSQHEDVDAEVAAEKGVGEEMLEGAEVSVGKFLDKKAEGLIGDFRRSKASISRFRNDLTALLAALEEEGKTPLPFFVLIDELDRCRPMYAIALLERIKHLFEVDNIVFIIATDSPQLRSSIKAVYGSDFDSGRYLLRFFDRSYVFEKPSYEAFVAYHFKLQNIDASILSSPPDTDAQSFFVETMSQLNLSLRDAEQCLDILRNILTMWPHQTEVQLIYLLPLIVAFQQGWSELFSALATRDRTQLLELQQTLDFKKWRISYDDPTPQLPDRTSNLEVLNILSERIVDRLGQPLPAVAGIQATEDRILRWFSEQARNELKMVHGTYDHENPPKSILLSYPQLVRNAGRLIKSAK